MKKRFFSFILILLLCVFNLFNTPLFAHAEESRVYSNVMTDLYKDNAFDPDDFNTVNTVELITVAESEDNELFLYTYQNYPKDITLFQVRLYLNDDLDTLDDYALQCLGKNDCFYKYKVSNITVSSLIGRSYNIVCLYRAFDSTLGDLQPDNDNTINYISIQVGKTYEFYNDGIVQKNLDVIEIKDMYVGFARLDGGFRWFVYNFSQYAGTSYCDRHFVAFRTNWQIDTLESAVVSYHRKDITNFGEDIEDLFDIYIEKSNEQWSYPLVRDYDLKTTCSAGSINTYDTTGSFSVIGSTQQSWDQIQTPTQFLSSVNYQEIYTFDLFTLKRNSCTSAETDAYLNQFQYTSLIVLPIP